MRGRPKKVRKDEASDAIRLGQVLAWRWANQSSNEKELAELRQEQRHLIEAGADVNQHLGGRGGELTPLMWAAQRNDEESVKELIKAGALVDKALLDGTTALMVAAASGSVEAIKALAKEGASQRAQGYLGRSAMSEAAMAGELGSIQALWELGASLSRLPNEEDSPIGSALRRNHFKAARWMLERGADWETNEGDALIQMIRQAADQSEADWIELIQRRGALEPEKLEELAKAIGKAALQEEGKPILAIKMGLEWGRKSWGERAPELIAAMALGAAGSAGHAASMAEPPGRKWLRESVRSSLERRLLEEQPNAALGAAAKRKAAL